MFNNLPPKEKMLKNIALILAICAVVCTIALIGANLGNAPTSPTVTLDLESTTSEKIPEDTSEDDSGTESENASSEESDRAPDDDFELKEHAANPAPENWTEDQIKTYNNPLFQVMAKLLANDQVFRQALTLETVNMELQERGLPLYTVNDLPLDVDYNTVISAMNHYIYVDDDYRGRVLALMISSLNTQQRQRIIEEFQGDPALSHEEVIPLIPDANGNYPNSSNYPNAVRA